MKIACVLGPKFEDFEFQEPYDALRKAGHEVTIVGLEADAELQGDKGKVKAKVDKSFQDVRPGDFDALLIPGGGSPDMGNVSANGHVLWLSGRWNGVVYAIDTRSGKLLAKIPVGASPHGLCVWPQPGRYSLGHTGILR